MSFTTRHNNLKSIKQPLTLLSELPGPDLHGVHGEHVRGAGDSHRQHPGLHPGASPRRPPGALLYRGRRPAGTTAPTVRHPACHAHSRRHAFQATR